VQPLAYDFTAHSLEAQTGSSVPNSVEVVSQTIGYETRVALVQHPPARLVYSLTLPVEASLSFGIGMAPEVWSPERGDGMDYRVYVRDQEDGSLPQTVFHRYIDPKGNPDDRRWFDERLRLDRFGGRAVEIVFEVMPGPAGDASYDWGGWSSPVLIDETVPGETSHVAGRFGQGAIDGT
jgi:hypothetical protein